MKANFTKKSDRTDKKETAVGSGSRATSENRAEEKEIAVKERKTAANGGSNRGIRGFFEGVLRYRFAISCVAVVILSAIVLGVVFGGRNASAGNDPENPDIIISNNTAAPTAQTTPEPEPTKVPSNYVHETIPPIETQEPYVDVPTPIPHTTPLVIEIDDEINAKYGEHNDLIPSVQERLMVLWYMDQDEPTDYFGRITKAALEAFQRRSELPVTGELDRTTYEMLFDVGAKAYLCTVGDSGTDVQAIEDRLYELGYLDSVSDTFDEETRAAVIDFQTVNNLTPDGLVGRNTKEALYNPESQPKAWTIGDQGDRILQFQNRLQELGYLTTEPDGIYGTDTQMAVRRFQMQNELVVDGYLGPTTREKLMSEDAVGNALSITMQGSDVLNVQVRLHALNYMRAQDVNGYFTSLTEQAVRLFQKNNNLQIDGKVGRNTMRVLMSENAVRASSPVTPPSNNNGGGNGGGGNGGGNGGGGNNGGGNGGGGNNGGGGSVESRINRFINVARSKLGCRYVRGGKGPNTFDCSGFVYWCLNHAGVSQGYMTSYMWRSCTRYQRNNNINSVRRGDVIVYYGHVAICSGTWTMIDASSSKGKVVERSFNGNYWHRNFICSFRIFT